MRRMLEGPARQGHAKAAVLVVDDIEGNILALETLLADMDCEVAVARRGSEALRLLLKREFAVMLLDVQMPEMDGYEVAQHARSNQSTREVPIIFLTAGNQTEDRVLRGYGSGAVDFLFKPVNAAILRSKVRVFLELFESRSQIATAKLELERTNAELRELATEKAALADRFKHANQELNVAYEELKATQSQLVQSAKMASLGELVAGVAHEINNPLSFAIGHLQTARKSLAQVDAELSELSAAGKEHWARAVNRLLEMNLGLERVRDLVIKLRTFSRLDEGEWGSVSLSESVDSVLTILGPRMRRGVEVETRFGEPDRIGCYPGPLNQAIANLVSNALDAMPEGGKLMIETGAVDASCEIVVTDSGSGIPAEIRERVLEPFFTTKPVGEGTGLGLSITYSIVKKHGGTLSLGEASGGGTRAVIRIPMEARHEP